MGWGNGLGPDGLATAKSLAPIEASGGPVVVPDAQLLFTADYTRVGDDLLLSGADGTTQVIANYFALDPAPILFSPDGAMMAPQLVATLVASQTPRQIAQVGPVDTEPPIGQVQDVIGTAAVIRDGVPVELLIGDPVFQNDVLQTGLESELAIGFADGTIFTLAANARITLDGMIYDPAGADNSLVLSVVQGTFTFVTGQIAPSGEMLVKTPVATIGIRGTIGVCKLASALGPLDCTVSRTEGGATNDVTYEDPLTGLVIANLSNPIGVYQIARLGAPVVERPATGQERIEFQTQSNTLRAAQVNIQLDIDLQQPIFQPESGESQRGDAGDTGEGDAPLETAAGPGPGPNQSGGIGGFDEPEFVETETPEEPVVTSNTPTIQTTSPPPSTSSEPVTLQTQVQQTIQAGPAPPTAAELPAVGEPEPTPDSEPGPAPDSQVPLDTDQVIVGTAGPDQVTTGAGNDTISTQAGADTISSGAGNDTITPGPDDDSVDAGPGDDTVQYAAGDGADTLIGGPGNDTVVITGVAGADAVTITGTAGDPNLTITVAGTSFLATGFEDIVVRGGDGNDTVLVSGDLTPSGVAQNTVTFEGGDGDDTFDGSGMTSPHSLDLQGGAGNDNLTGGPGDDIISGGTGNDTIDGGGGADVAVFAGNFADFGFQRLENGDLAVTDIADGSEGTDTLRNVEILRFADRDVSPPVDFDIAATANFVEDLAAGGVTFADGIGVGIGLGIAINRNSPLINGLGGPAGFGDLSAITSDDDSVLTDISAAFPGGINIGGTLYTEIFIGSNGYVTFGESDTEYDPSDIDTSIPRLAVFFADVDVADFDPSAASPGGVSQGTDDVYVSIQPGVVTITWDDVHPFDIPFGGSGSEEDFQNAFQLRIVDQGGGNFSVEYRYENIDWTDGTDELPETALVGIFDGNGNNLVLPASGDPSQIGNLPNNSNVGISGVFAFSVVDGAPVPVAGALPGLLYEFQVGEAGIVADNIRGTDAEDGVTAQFTITSPPRDDAGNAVGLLLVDRGDDDVIDEIVGPGFDGVPVEVQSGDSVFYFLPTEGLADKPDQVAFAYFTTDSDGLTSDGATVTVQLGNAPPAAADDALGTDEDTALAGNVLLDNGNGADGDPEGDALSVTAVNGVAADVGQQIVLASGALLTLNANGSFDYDPNGQFEGLPAGQSGADSFAYTITDGNGGFDTATVNIAVEGVNDSPVVDLNGAEGGIDIVRGFTEGGGPIILAPSGIVFDLDSGTLASLTVSLVDPPDGAAEVLSATASGGVTITGLGTGTLTLSGGASLAEYQAVLRTVSYDNTSANPTAGGRAVQVRGDDGSGSSNLSQIATATVNVGAVNDAPVLNTNALTLNEGETVVLTGANLSATDVDSADPGLIFAVAGVTGGRFELGTNPGVAIAQFTQGQVTAGAVRFVHDGGEAAPAYTVTVGDGTDTTAPAAANVVFIPVNDPPVLNTNALTVQEDGLAVLGPANLSALDPDNTASELQFDITGLSGGRFFLNSAPAQSITSFTQTQVNAGLVHFLHDGEEAPPSYSVSVTDGTTPSAPAAAAITFTPVNDPPVIDLNGLDGAVFTEQLAPVRVDSDLTISDPDSATLSGASVTILNLQQPGSEFLSLGDFTPPNINVSFNAQIGVLTLSGVDTLAAYQQALRLVEYRNISNDPTLGGAQTQRTIGFTVNDSATASLAALATINLAAVNDSPVNTVPGAQSTGTAADLVFSGANGNALAIADPDAGANDVQVTLSVANGVLTLASPLGLTFTAGTGTADASMTFTGTLAAINAALAAGVTYAPNAGFVGPDTLTIATDDLGNTGSPGALSDTDGIAITVSDQTGDTVLQGLSLIVGNTGTGTFSLSNGTGLLLSTAIVGNTASGIGTLDVTGVETTLDVTAGTSLTVGGAGTGTLNVTDGATVTVGTPGSDAEMVIGDQATGVGTVTVNAATLSVNGSGGLAVGNLGTGTLRIENASFVEVTSDGFNNVDIGRGASGVGTVVVTGGSALRTIGTDNAIQVGRLGTGNFTVEAGARAETLRFSVGDGGTGSATITGLNSALVVSSEDGRFNAAGGFDFVAGVVTVAGGVGVGTLSVLDQAKIAIRPGLIDNTDTSGPGMQIGENADSRGAVIVDGAGSLIDISQTSPVVSFGPFFQVGDRGDGSLTIQNEGQVAVTGKQASFTVSFRSGGTGFLDIDSGGKLVVDGDGTAAFITIGNQDNTNGRVKVDGSADAAGTRSEIVLLSGPTGAQASFISVGLRGTGSLDILGGARVRVDGETGVFPGIEIGGDESNGILAGNGAVTVSGTGSELSIAGDGGLVQVGDGGAGTLTVDDNALVKALQLDVARAGTATTTISNGGRVVISNDEGRFTGNFVNEAGFASVGWLAGSDGTLNVISGGVLEVRSGQGVNQDTFGPQLDIARDSGSKGAVLVSGDGSRIDISQTAPAGSDPNLFPGPALRLGRTGGDGTLTIEKSGQVNLSGESSRVIVSNGAGATSSVEVKTGGQLKVAGVADSFFSVGQHSGAAGTVLLTGQNSKIVVDTTQISNGSTTFGSTVKIGRFGDGTLEIADGGQFTVISHSSSFFSIGDFAGSTGRVLVDGAGSRLDILTRELSNDQTTFGPGLRVGKEAAGILEITNGGVVNVAGPQPGEVFAAIGHARGSTGFVSVESGGTISIGGFLSIGDGFFDDRGTPGDPSDNVGQENADAVGTLEVHGGAVTSQGANIGFATRGVGTAIVDHGGAWTDSIGLNVGNEGTGRLFVERGGTVTANGPFNNIANFADSHGEVHVAAGGQFTVNGGLTVGNGSDLSGGTAGFGPGVGLLNISGGTVTTQGADIGGQILGVGTVIVDDGGTWTNIGAPGNPNSSLNVGSQGKGTLDIRDGTVNANGPLNFIANAAGSEGTVVVRGVGSQINVTNTLIIGNGGFFDNGTPGDPSDDFGVLGAATNGSLSLFNSAVASLGSWLRIGNEANSQGTVLVSGASQLSVSDFVSVGQSQGTGTLNVVNGGTVSAPSINIGANGTLNAGKGTINLGSPAAPGTLTNAGTVILGEGPGTLTVNGNYNQNGSTLLLKLGLGGANAVATGIADFAQGTTVRLEQQTGVRFGDAIALTALGGAAGLDVNAIAANAVLQQGFGIFQQEIGDTVGFTTIVDNTDTGSTGQTIAGEVSALDGTLRVIVDDVDNAGGGFGIEVTSSLGAGLDSFLAINGVVSTNGILVDGEGTSQLTLNNTSTATNLNVNGLAAGAQATAIVGSSGSLTLANNAIVGDTGSGLAELFVHGIMSVPDLIVGNQASSNGWVTVAGGTLDVTGTNTLVVGQQGTGELIVSDGGVVNVAGSFFISNAAGSTGKTTVTDDGSQLNVTNNAFVANGFFNTTGFGIPGAASNGTLNVLDGGVARFAQLFVGTRDNATGTVVVDGEGSRLTAESDPSNFPQIVIGTDFEGTGVGGRGEVTVSNGGFLGTPSVQVGQSASGGTVTVTGDGSQLIAADFFAVANAAAATGTLNVLDGGSVSFGGNLGIGTAPGADGTISVDGAGSSLTTTGSPSDTSGNFIGVGAFFGNPGGTGAFEITNGGLVRTKSMRIGDGPGGSGTVLVDGPGSRLVTFGSTLGSDENTIRIGRSAGGDGMLTVSNGGFLSAGNLSVSGSGVAKLVVTGPDSMVRLSNDEGIVFGDPREGGFLRAGGGGGETGEIEVSAGGNIIVTSGPTQFGPGLQIARNDGSTGKVTIDGAGAAPGETFIEIATPNLVTDPDSFGPYLVIHNGAGTVNIINGGELRVIGDDASAVISNNRFDIPAQLPLSTVTINTGGKLIVDSGANPLGAEIVIGQKFNSNGKIVVDGSADPEGTRSEILLSGGAAGQQAAFFSVGLRGTGALNILGGARVLIDGEAGDFPGMNVGGSSGSPVGGTGVVLVDGPGSTLEMTGDATPFFGIGNTGTGLLTVSGGGQVILSANDPANGPDFDIGFNAQGNGTVVVTGVGSTVVLQGRPGVDAGSMDIGRLGQGSLSILDGGTVSNDSNGITTIGREAGATGAALVQGTDATSVSTLNAGAFLLVGMDFDFDTGTPLGAGTGGAGTLTIGEFGSVNADQIFVGTGGAIQGTGAGLTATPNAALNGALTVDGGTVAAGFSAGTLGISGDFVLRSGVMEFELGGASPHQSDLIDIGGAAQVLGGRFDFQMIDSYVAQAGDEIVVLNAAGGLSANAQDVSLAFSGVTADFRFEVSYGAEDVTFTALNDAALGSSTIFLGGNLDDVFEGGPGDDTIFGGGGADTLIGGTGADRLTGGAGADTLIGGTGADRLTGGAGADTFGIGAGDGGPTIDLADVIADFEDGLDRIGLTGGLGFADLSLAGDGAGGTVVSVAATLEILAVVDGIAPNLLDETDFTAIV